MEFFFLQTLKPNFLSLSPSPFFFLSNLLSLNRERYNGEFVTEISVVSI